MDEQKNQPDVEQGNIPAPSQTCTPTSSSLGGTKDDEPSEKEEETQTDKCICYSLSVLVLIPVLALALAITPIISIPLLPPMLAFYFIAHIVQVFRRDEDNEVGMVMRDIAKWLSILCGLISVYLLLCMLIFGVTPSLKHLEFEGVSITRWIGALAIICVFFTYSTVVRLVLSYRGRKRRGASHLYEGIIGSINSVFYLLALLSVTRVVPILKHHKILSLSAQKWIRMILLVTLGHHAVCIVTSSIVLSLRSKYIERGQQRLHDSNSNLSNILGSALLKQLLDGFIDLFRKPTPTGDHTHEKRLVEKLKSLFCKQQTTGGDDTVQWTKYIVYYAEGLRISFNFVLTSLLVLLTWILYFGSRLSRSSSEIRHVYDFVFWTSFCILVTAFLWLVKSGVVLSWKARVVYNPFKKMRPGEAIKLYLIGIIAGPEFDVLGIWKKVERDHEADGAEQDEARGKDQRVRKAPDENVVDQGRQRVSQLQNEQGNETSLEINGEEGSGKGKIEELGAIGENQAESENQQPANQGTSQEDRGHYDSETYKRDEIAEARAWQILVREEDSKDSPYTSDIARIARYFMAAEGPLSKDGYVSDFVAQWRRANRHLSDKSERTNRVPVHNLHGSELDDEDVDLLFKQLHKDKYKITDSEKWITKYHKVCLDLGWISRYIVGTMELVDYLNNIMVVVLVAVMIIIWLLLTKIATTKVLVLIASPVIGASFIFGESASNLFKGIMFTYVTHPFDVGDLCTIEDVQVVVKRIGIWKTLFSKVGTTDEVVYPNTVLATTSIVNHKGTADPNDYVELRLNPATKMEQILLLKSKIEEHLDHNKEGFKNHPHGVLVKDIGETVTIAVHFKHDKAKIESMMPTDRVQKRSERRHAFLLQMKAFLDELDIKQDTNTHSSSSPTTPSNNNSRK